MQTALKDSGQFEKLVFEITDNLAKLMACCNISCDVNWPTGFGDILQKCR